MYPRSSLRCLKLLSIHVLWTWELGLHSKSSISPGKKLDSCSLRPARKTPIYLFIETATLVRKYLSFWKKHAAFHFFIGKSSLILQFHLNKSNNGYGSQHSQCTLPWSLSHGMGQCVLAMSLQSSGSRRTCFCDPRYWDLVAKKYFPLRKLDACSHKTARKTTWFVFSSWHQ